MVKVDLSGCQKFFDASGPDFAAAASAPRVLTEKTGQGADFTGWAIAGAASEGAWVSYPIAIESYIAKGEDSTTGKQLAQVTYTVGISPESVS